MVLFFLLSLLDIVSAVHFIFCLGNSEFFAHLMICKGVFFSLVCGSFLDFFNLLDLASGVIYLLVSSGVLSIPWCWVVYGLLFLKGLMGVAPKSL
jgi:hypothetical protein